jgi:hypothetical protein
MSQLYIPHIRFHQLEPEPAKHHTQREIHLRPREIHAQAAARTAAEAHHEALERHAVMCLRVVEPALWDEVVRIWENGFVVRDFGDGHGLLLQSACVRSVKVGDLQHMCLKE